MSMTLMQEIKQVKVKLIQAALDLASAKSWSDITMHDIATESRVEGDIALILFRCKMDILIALNRQIDDQLSEIYAGEALEGDTPRDRLFDIIMERFDLMNDNRAAYLSILNSVTLDPKTSITSLPFLYQSLSHMMGLAGMDNQGLKSPIKTIALGGLYLKTLRDWCKDDSADMAATMASLDKGLGFLDDKILGF